MALLREWFELKKERAFPKKFPYQVIIAVAVFALLMAVFNLPEKNYRIYDGAVSEETGTVFLSAQYGGKSVLYIYSAEGECIGEYCFVEKLARSQFNRVFRKDGFFWLYSQDQGVLYKLDDAGKVQEAEKLNSETCDYYESLDTWVGWEKNKNKYSVEINGILYEYNDSDYFSLKFKGDDRTFTVTDSDKSLRLVWDSSVRDNDREFETLTCEN